MVGKKPRRILRIAQVEDRTALSRETIYRGGREGWFPKPVKLTGGNASGWFEDEIDSFFFCFFLYVGKESHFKFKCEDIDTGDALFAAFKDDFFNKETSDREVNRAH